MAGARTLRICRACHKEKNINCAICDMCRGKMERAKNKFGITSPHRCKTCGNMITIKQCLQCELEKK